MEDAIGREIERYLETGDSDLNYLAWEPGSPQRTAGRIPGRARSFRGGRSEGRAP